MATLSEQLDTKCKTVKAARDRYDADNGEQSKLSLALALGSLNDVWEQRGDEDVEPELEQAVVGWLKLQKQFQVVVSHEGSFNHESTRQSISTPTSDVENKLVSRMRKKSEQIKRSYDIFFANSNNDNAQDFISKFKAWEQLSEQCEEADIDKDMVSNIHGLHLKVQQWMKCNPNMGVISNANAGGRPVIRTRCTQ